MLNPVLLSIFDKHLRGFNNAAVLVWLGGWMHASISLFLALCLVNFRARN